MRGRAIARDDEGHLGFTVLEMVVTMAILGILASIALPTFRTARQRADDGRTQTALTTAARAAFVYAVETEVFDDSEAARAELVTIEPSLSFVDGASTDERTVAIADDADGVELALAARSASGTCFYMRLSHVTLESRHSDDPPECRAADYVDGPNSGW